MDAFWLVSIFWLGILTFLLGIFILVLVFKIYSRLGQNNAAPAQRIVTGVAQGDRAGDDPIIPPPIPPPPGGGGG